MKAPLVFTLLLAAFLTVAGANLLRAEDWTTTDGKVYHNVMVVKTEADAVTILHQDGGALVPLIKLSPELRKRFNYDPDKAEAAAVARVIADAENAKALQAEIEQTRQMKQMKLEAQDPRFANRTTSPSLEAANASADAASSLPSASLNPNRHSIDDLVSSAQSLRLDPSEPNHSTTSHLLLESHNLSGDPNDPTRHSANALINGDPLSGRQ